MSKAAQQLAELERNSKLLPRSIFTDGYGNVPPSLEERARLKWWQEIRYDMFGKLPAGFERDPIDD